jgi:hypothetical protein
MRHSRELEFRLAVNTLPVEAVEHRRRSGSVKAAIVKAQSDFGHSERSCLLSPQPPPKEEAKPFKMYVSSQKVKHKARRNPGLPSPL